MVDFNTDIRTVDGSENQPEGRGEVDGEVIRIFPNAYEDGFNAPRGGGIGENESSLPNARDISNAISAQGDVTGNPLNASDWLWQWGQFLDHDLSISEGSNISELPDEEVAELQFDIPLDPTDQIYGERFTEIPVNRVEQEEGTGTGPDNIRQFPNEITSFIDGSNGYGSENERAGAKRTSLNESFFGVGVEEVPGFSEGAENPFDGKLLTANDTYGTDGIAFEGGSDPNNTSGEILAPYNRNNSENADPGDRTPNNREFISGDIRINEQVGLISIHTILIREHNTIADKVAFHLDRGDDAALNEAFEQYQNEYVPSLELETQPSPEQIRGEFIYEAARAVIGAKSQVITYNEFLPILVGNESPEDLQAIDESILDPSVSASFAGAAYRLGHTLLSDNIRTIDTESVDSISLRDAFFNPDFVSSNGLDDILTGLNYQQANNVDTRVIDGVRNNLFGPPGNGGQDLVAINLQRGRDLGLPGYVEIYNQLNPDSQITSFDDLNAIFGSEEIVNQFRSAYESIDQIDLWLGGLAEQPAEEGILLGSTFKAIVEDQFARSRDNDRFFFTDQLADSESFLSVVTNAVGSDIANEGLDDIIRNNVAHPELVPDDAFRVPFENEVTGTLESDNGDNAVVGGDTADLITAQTGNDEVFGGLGDDILLGELGNDDLRGGAGADTLVGGEGDDILRAEGNGDILSGGVGNDSYLLSTETAGGTQIYDDGGADSISITDPIAEGSGLEARPEVELTIGDPNPAFRGLRKSEDALEIDLNQNGIIDPETDLVIADYFADGEDGQIVAGVGAVENINNVTTDELLEYANSDGIANGSPIFRFLNPALGVHFYTASEGERDNILNDPGLSSVYDFEGESYIGAPHDEDPLTGAQPVFRFLNTETQVHFYTISEAERDNVINDPGLSSVFSFEGVAYYGSETPIEGYTPLYRFLNTNVDTPAHFYTPSAGERDNLLNDPGLSSVYQPEGNEEGAAFYIQPLEAEV